MMGPILGMIRKDLLRKRRSPLGVAVMLLFPVSFAAILALAFGGDDVPRVHLLVENLDDTFLGEMLVSALGAELAAEFFDVEVVGEEGLERLGKGQGSALLRIPKGFSEDVLYGTPTELELYRNPAQGIMPEVAEQVAGVLTEVLGAASRVMREPLDAVAPYTDSPDLEISDQTVAEVAVAVKGVFEGAGRFLSPPVVELESVALGDDGEEQEEDEDGSGSSAAFSIFLIVFPGVSVWSLFMIGDACMRDILTESEAGTLRRQLHAPISTGTLVLAKAGFTGVVSLIALAILSVIGALAADRPVDPVAYLLLSLALVVAVTGAGATIYGFAGNQNRGATMASLIYLGLGFASGSFIQFEALPAVMRSIAPVSPFYWANQGYQQLIQSGAGLAGVATSVIVLTVVGVALLALGAVLLNRHLARGTA